MRDTRIWLSSLLVWRSSAPPTCSNSRDCSRVRADSNIERAAEGLRLRPFSFTGSGASSLLPLPCNKVGVYPLPFPRIEYRAGRWRGGRCPTQAGPVALHETCPHLLYQPRSSGCLYPSLNGKGSASTAEASWECEAC